MIRHHQGTTPTARWRLGRIGTRTMVVLGVQCVYQGTSHGQLRWSSDASAPLHVVVTHDEAGAASWCVSVYPTVLSTRSRLQLICESAAELAEAEDLVMWQWEAIKSAMAALNVGP